MGKNGIVPSFFPLLCFLFGIRERGKQRAVPYFICPLRVKPVKMVVKIARGDKRDMLFFRFTPDEQRKRLLAVAAAATWESTSPGGFGPWKEVLRLTEDLYTVSSLSFTLE